MHAPAPVFAFERMLGATLGPVANNGLPKGQQQQ